MGTLKTSFLIPNDHPAIVDVLVHGVSISQSAKKHGFTTPTLRNYLLRHPDYAKAKADGRLHQPKTYGAASNEELKDHPAVLEVLKGEMTLGEIGAKYGVNPVTLSRWVKRTNPDIAGKTGPGGRPQKIKKSESAAVLMAVATVKQLAKSLGITPLQACKLIRRNLEADAALTP